MDTETAAALINAKAILIAENSENPQDVVAYAKRSTEPPVTIEQLRDTDQDLERRFRFGVPKEQQASIRATLDARFGRSTVGDLWEVVARRVLDRGAVLNDEEQETIEPMADVFIQYAIEVLGEKEAYRLTSLWTQYRKR